jgi:flagellar secretion chaperone FliS
MQPRFHPAIASQHYRMLELKSRIESASPHGLVGLLYEELLRALDLAVVSAAKGRAISGSSHIAKALAIIVALEGSLDLEKGGDLALMLARVYRACSQGLNEAVRSGDTDTLSEIRNAISDIAYAWQAMASD